jgi:hypothetical protein
MLVASVYILLVSPARVHWAHHLVVPVASIYILLVSPALCHWNMESLSARSGRICLAILALLGCTNHFQSDCLSPQDMNRVTNLLFVMAASVTFHEL